MPDEVAVPGALGYVKGDSRRVYDLIHRITDIGKCAYSLLEDDLRVAGVMLVRSLLETSAMAHSLLQS